MTTSPTQRSLKHLRDDGYLAAVVEHWNPHARIRQDLFGCIDILAIKAGSTLAVQTTSYSNMSARVKKIQAADELRTMLDAGWKIEVHGWKKVKNRWEVKVREVVPEATGSVEEVEDPIAPCLMPGCVRPRSLHNNFCAACNEY